MTAIRMTKAPVEVPSPHSENEVCPHCGEDFGVEDSILYTRETQRDKDHEHYTGIVKRAFAEVEGMSYHDAYSAVRELKSRLLENK